MYVDYENKVAYCGAPRTGTRTVSTVLQSLGFASLDSHHSNVCSSVSSIYSGEGAIFYNQYLRHGGWKVLTVVRNHFDRLASHYRLNSHLTHPKEQDPELDRTILKLMKQGRQVNGYRVGFYYLPWTLYSTHIIRYENLVPALTEFLTECGYTDYEIPHIGQGEASHVNYQQYFSDVTRQAVEREYATEMFRLGYEW